MEDHPFDNPQPVDDTLLERIESGQEELTDQLFFKLIKETPLYLGHWPFQTRIAEWQYCLNNPLYSDVEQKDASNTEKRNAMIRGAEKKDAKRKLLQIGHALAYEHKGRPGKIPDIGIHHQYKKAVEEIGKFLQEHKNDTSLERLRNFQSSFPESSKYVDFKRHRTAGEIAFHLIVKKYQISQRSLRALISNPPSYIIHPKTIPQKPE